MIPGRKPIWQTRECPTTEAEGPQSGGLAILGEQYASAAMCGLGRDGQDTRTLTNEGDRNDGPSTGPQRQAPRHQLADPTWSATPVAQSWQPKNTSILRNDPPQPLGMRPTPELTKQHSEAPSQRDGDTESPPCQARQQLKLKQPGASAHMPNTRARLVISLPDATHHRVNTQRTQVGNVDAALRDLALELGPRRPLDESRTNLADSRRFCFIWRYKKSDRRGPRQKSWCILHRSHPDASSALKGPAPPSSSHRS